MIGAGNIVYFYWFLSGQEFSIGTLFGLVLYGFLVFILRPFIMLLSLSPATAMAIEPSQPMLQNSKNSYEEKTSSFNFEAAPLAESTMADASLV